MTTAAPTYDLGKLHGGLRLEAHKSESTQLPIQDLPIPSQLVLPIDQHVGDAAQPVVGIGEHVLKGQLIAEPYGSLGAPVHASSSGKVVAIDLLEMPELPGVTFAQMDFLDDRAPDKLRAMIGGGADIVMSDMAANTTGHRKTDQLRIIGLVENAAAFACEILNPGGVFLAKVFQSGAEADLLAQLKRDFTTVKHVKPAASRQDSSERYLLALGFRGDNGVST